VALTALEGSLARARHHAGLLANAGAWIEQLETAVVLAQAEVAWLRASHSTHADRISAALTSVLAARTAIVVVHLAALERCVLPPSMFVGTATSVADVRARMFDRIGRINAAWRLEARALRGLPHAARLLRLAGANAELAFGWIAAHPDVEHFLREGIVDRDPAIRHACGALSLTTGVPMARHSISSRPLSVSIQSEPEPGQGFRAEKP